MAATLLRLTRKHLFDAALILFTILAVLLFLGMSTAHAQYRYRSRSYTPTYNYYQPQCYSAPHCQYPYWTAWSYKLHTGCDSYYQRARYYYTAAGSYTTENDGWLYTRHWDGYQWCYTKWKLISEYAAVPAAVVHEVVREVPVVVEVPQLGSTVAGYPAASSFQAVKSNALSVLQQYPLQSLGALLRDKEGDRYAAAAHELAKVSTYSAQTARELSVNGQQIQRERNAAEAELRRLAIQGAIVENVVVKAFQNVIGVGGQALVNAEGQITPNGANGLAALVEQKCFSCHGGDKVEKGLDFTKIAEFDTKTWAKIYKQVLTGRMPPPDSGVEAINEQELKFFEAALDSQ